MAQSMSYRHIEVERRGRIAVVRLNRPRYRNAQSRVLLEEMTSAFAELDLDNSVHVIVLAGAGEHFSAGHDLGTPEEVEDAQTRPFGEGALGRINRSWHLYVENSLRWRDVKKPTIAQVQGYCIFGGFLIASCMDIIIAADNAKFLPSHLQLFTAPWAENSLLTLRMLKQSINGAQDAMGYRTALHATHSNYMVLEMTRTEREGEIDPAGRRLGGVTAALAKEQRFHSQKPIDD